MRVTDYTMSQQLLYQFGNSSQALAKSYSELSSGQKLINPSDNPSEMAHVLSQTSDLRKIEQFKSNITRATQVSTVTYANIKSLKDITTRASELGTVDDLTNAAAYEAKRAELNGLIEQAIQVANAQQNGQYLFGANRTNAAPFTVARDTDGNATGVTYAGSTSSSSIPVSDNVNVNPYSTPTQNQQIGDVLDHLIALRDALDDADPTATKAANVNVVADEDVIINQMSEQAAIQSRLELISDQHKSSTTATTVDISARADVDIAEATVRYNMMQNAYQASVAAGSKMLSVSLLNYLP